MATLSGVTPPYPSYNFDDTMPPPPIFTNEMYGNDVEDDCVIAARAHQTVRFVWKSKARVPTIFPTDVTNQYANETRGKTGLLLTDSLNEWRDTGWTFGSDTNVHRIASRSDSYSIDGGKFPVTDPTMVLNQQQLQTLIYISVGVQINLALPQNVGFGHQGTFGPGNPWLGTSNSRGKLHVMLLTGYVADTFVGITWAQRQEMDWAFLEGHCWGVFTVEPNDSTY